MNSLYITLGTIGGTEWIIIIAVVVLFFGGKKNLFFPFTLPLIGIFITPNMSTTLTKTSKKRGRPRTGNTKRPFCLSINSDVLKTARRQAAKRGMSLSFYIESAVRSQTTNTGAEQ